MNKRAFTLKSILLGLFGLLIVSIFPSYSVSVLKLKGSIKGYLPVVPLFLIVVLSYGWNRIAGRFNRRLALSARELAVVFGLMAMVSWLPGVQQAMVRHVVLPRYEELTTNASWQEAGVTTRLPDRLFPRGVNGEMIGEQTHFGMIQGGMDLDAIPYSAWIAPLLNWMPFPPSILWLRCMYPVICWWPIALPWIWWVSLRRQKIPWAASSPGVRAVVNPMVCWKRLRAWG